MSIDLRMQGSLESQIKTPKRYYKTLNLAKGQQNSIDSTPIYQHFLQST